MCKAYTFLCEGRNKWLSTDGTTVCPFGTLIYFNFTNCCFTIQHGHMMLICSVNAIQQSAQRSRSLRMIFADWSTLCCMDILISAEGTWPIKVHSCCAAERLGWHGYGEHVRFQVSRDHPFLGRGHGAIFTLISKSLFICIYFGWMRIL
jgi:hypothetical protein